MKYSMSWLGTLAHSKAPMASGSSFNRVNLAQMLKGIQQALHRPLIQKPDLKVWQTLDDDGTVWWSACDPETDRSVYRVTEAEIRSWVEQRYSY